MMRMDLFCLSKRIPLLNGLEEHLGLSPRGRHPTAIERSHGVRLVVIKKINTKQKLKILLVGNTIINRISAAQARFERILRIQHR
jgi:hypothetical protein